MRFIFLSVLIGFNYQVGCDCAGNPGPAPTCDRPGLPSCDSSDGSVPDAGAVADAGTADSGVTDAGVFDAGVFDAGVDAGAPPLPTAATGLTWVQPSPSRAASLSATWVVSSSNDATDQKIQFYSDGTCLTPSGALIDLGSPTVATRNFTAAANGTFSFNITTVNPTGSTTSACSPSMVVDTGPALGFTPASHDFGTLASGYAKSGSFQFTLTNAWVGPGTACTAPMLSNTASFEITLDTCGTADLLAGASCTLNVRALAAGSGLAASTLSRSCTTGGVVSTGIAQVQVSYVAASANLVAVSERDGDFGTVTLNKASSTKDVVFGNTGLVDAVACGAPALTDATHFSIISHDCGATISSGAHCTVHVRARPVATGTRTSSVSLTCAGNVASLPLQVVAEAAATPTSIAIGIPSVFLMSDKRVRLSGFGSYLPFTSSLFTDALGVATGSGYFCGIHTPGTVACWGHNTFGQIGDGTTVDALGAVAASVVGVTGATAIAANSGGAHTCAITGAGTVRCWGQNDFGQLGNNSIVDSAVPVSTGITNATAIAVGIRHSCAILADQTMRCWGSNSAGELGDGTTIDRHVPVAVKINAGTNLTGVTAMALGEFDNTCAVSGGTARCWGNGGYGKIGDGTLNDRLFATPVTGLTNVTAVSINFTSACALLADGTARCWGSNGTGELGDGSTTDSALPVTVMGLTGGMQISSHWRTTCVLKSNAEIQCWGLDDNATMATGVTGVRSLATQKTGLTNVTEIACGHEGSCALLSDQTVKCWGDWASNGQFASGYVSVSTPTTLPGIAGAVHVAASDTTNCVLLSDGSIRCLGLNNAGQLGAGSAVGASGTPVSVLGINSATQISGGQTHFCARLSDGTARCWGGNGASQLGNGGTADSSTPVMVAGLTGIAKIYAGNGQHSCALLTSGDVTCWGKNANGQLGDGTVTDRTAPTLVPGLHGVTALALGLAHTCALLSDGTGLCWGANAANQLGDGTAVERHSPVNVGWYSNFSSLSAGPNHTCGVLVDGKVRCWGTGVDGVLGAGSLADAALPAQSAVFSLTNVLQMSSSTNWQDQSGNVNCAVVMGGTVSCWGVEGVGIPRLGLRSVSGFIP